MPTVTIDVSEDGDTKVKVEGQCGPGCKELTKAIESAIGQTTSDVLTPEFHRSAIAQQKKEQRS